MQTLRAFESAGRLQSFSRAAAELDTTRSAVSRAIADLERRIAARLFDRRHRSVSLTEAGELYHRAVSDGLARIARATSAATIAARDNRIVIACGRATSELFLMPRIEALRRELGDDAVLRVLRCENNFLARPELIDIDNIDLLVSYHGATDVPANRVVTFHEAVAPVCSPEFAATHADTLRRPVTQGGSLPFLNLARPTRGWATWDNWFEAVGRPVPMPRFRNFDDYVYMLDAAAAGQGLALGWRNFMDRFFNAGSLLAVGDGFVEFDRPLVARLTERGLGRPLALRCFAVLASLTR